VAHQAKDRAGPERSAKNETAETETAENQTAENETARPPDGVGCSRASKRGRVSHPRRPDAR
jgi:hypothetical protein